MKNLKKVLALVVALTMVFTTVAFASYPDVDANADYASAVELLSALEILKGDDNGNFNPDNTITRAEYAAVVCRALGWEASANGAKGATMFTDVAADHWASGYINLASQQGIVNGKGNGIFDPEGNVTFTEAVKMLVVAIGFEPMAAQKGGWPTGYLTVANSIKMTAGVAATGTDAAALRSTVAQLTANAIEIPVMDQVSYGTLTEYIQLNSYNNYKSLLSAMDVYKVTGVIKAVREVEGKFDFEFTAYPDDYSFGYTTNGAIDKSLNGDNQTLIGHLETKFDVADSNVLDYVDQNVDIYLKKVNRVDYEALIVVPSGIGETLTLSVEDFDWDAKRTLTDKSQVAKSIIDTANPFDVEYYETKDANRTTKVYIAANPTVKVNGRVVNDGNKKVDLTDLAKYKSSIATVTFTENTNDKYFDTIEITEFEYGIVEDVFADKDRIEFVDGNRVTFDPTNDEQIVAIYNAEGAEIAITDIVAGDVLAMVVGDELVSGSVLKAKAFKDKITIYNLGQSSVTGTVTGLSEEDNELVIDGTAYEYMADNWVADKAGTFVKDALGAEGIFYLGLDGKIIGFDGSSVVSGNYGFIIQSTLNETGFAPHYQIKLLTADAGIVVFDVDTECDIDASKALKVELGEDKNNDGKADIVDNQKLGMAEYNSTDKVNAYKRLVKYDTNKQGEIDEIEFVNGQIKVNDECSISSASVKVDGEKLDANAVVFDISASDIEDAKVVDISTLIADVKYEGFVFDVGSTKDNDIFLMTVGGAVFAGEDNLFVVDSVVDTTYEDEKAIQVTYYAAGESKANVAIFTEDSNGIKGSIKYDDVDSAKKYKFTKGSVFVANVAEDGFVTDYAILATMNAGVYDVSNLKSVADEAFKNDLSTKERDGVEFVYGYVYDMDKSEIQIGSRWYDITNATAQYAYNTNGSKARVDVGLWDAVGVDKFIFEYEDKDNDYTYTDGKDTYKSGKATLVLLKTFDGDVTDIISITARQPIAKFADAQIVKYETNAPQQGPTASAVEVEVEVEVEDIVEVDPIDFE